MGDERPGSDESDEDTEGQTLMWKVRKPVPETNEDDAEGQGIRPPPDLAVPGIPTVEDDDEVEGHGGMSGSPRPPVD